jgi:hypothetical protein
MQICHCAMAGTKACLTCANSMSGTWGRYPAPYAVKLENCPTTYIEPDWKRLQDLSHKKLVDLYNKMQEASEKADHSTLRFGTDHDGEVDQQVSPI